MQHITDLFRRTLSPLMPADELQELTLWTIEELTGLSRTQILLGKDKIFSPEIHAQAETVARRIADGEPIQYIFGYTDFMGLRLQVSPSVLIPRPETTELVEWILDETGKNKRCIDCGTGSGCIAISLKKHRPDWSIEAIDLSGDALRVARRNASVHHADIAFRLADMLHAEALTGQYDLIVSNPPYIPQSEQSEMEQNVVAHEPGMALFVPDQSPLIFYHALAQHALKSLNPSGKIFVETHHQTGKAVGRLFEEAGLRHVVLRKDISGCDRMVCAQR